MPERIDARLEQLARRRTAVLDALPTTEQAVMALRDIVDQGLPGYTEPPEDPFAIPDDITARVTSRPAGLGGTPPARRATVGRGPLPTRFRTRRRAVRRTAPQPAMTAAPQPGRDHDTDEADQSRYLVNVLGHFDVWHGERDLTPPAGHCAAVVQLLALHDGVMHRDRLVAELWPDDPPWVGLQRLRNVLSRLRPHIGPLVGRDRRRNLVRFAQPVRVDLTEFLTFSGQAITLARTDPEAAVEHGTRALMLYRGPLLLDQPFAEWAYPPRIHAAERHRFLLSALAETSQRQGESEQAGLYRHEASPVAEGAVPESVREDRS